MATARRGARPQLTSSLLFRRRPSPSPSPPSLSFRRAPQQPRRPLTASPAAAPGRKAFRAVSEAFPRRAFASRSGGRQRQQGGQGEEDVHLTDPFLQSLAEQKMTDSRGRPVLKLAVEGNIAAGKSSFLRILEDAHLDYVVVQEPISKWQRVQEPTDDEDWVPTASQENGGNLLDLFYTDPQRYAYTFQSYAFLSRMRAQLQPFSAFEDQLKRGPPREEHSEQQQQQQQQHDSPQLSAGEGVSPEAASSSAGVADGIPSASASAASSSKRSAPESTSDGAEAMASSEEPPQKRAHVVSPPVIQFFERSVFSDRYCFAHNCHQQGLFSDLEWGIYRDWHHWLTHAFPQLRLDGLIYLRTKPQTCFDRLHKRDRSEESGVGLDYLESIHERHEDWLIHKAEHVRLSDLIKDVPILILECDEEFEAEPKRRTAMLNDISAFVEKLKK